MQSDKTSVPEQIFTAHRLAKMFQITATKQTLFNAEERGDIPRASRIQRGQTSCRAWKLNQLPVIGEKMGFLRKPETPQVVSIFSLKGGTSKSSLCFQIARSFALHNVRTLVIGLDAQETVTQTLNRTTGTNSDEDAKGIFHVLTQAAPLEEVLHATDLPTLHYIPETIELSVLDIWLKTQMRKEYIIKERLVGPLLRSGKYDLILFDCNPAWSEMVTGALGASDVLLSPLGADINSLKAAKIFVELLADFQDEMKHVFRSLLIIPTMVEANKLSQTILAKYRLQYGELCTAASIRRAIAIQEANVQGKSMMEVGYSAPVLHDLLGVMKEINECLLVSPSLEQATIIEGQPVAQQVTA
jgi:chromosome partitioning protein